MIYTLFTTLFEKIHLLIPVIILIILLSFLIFNCSRYESLLISIVSLLVFVNCTNFSNVILPLNYFYFNRHYYFLCICTFLCSDYRKYAKKDTQLIVDIARTYFNADPVAYDKDIQKAMKNAFKTNPQDPSYFIFIGDTIAKTAGSDNVKVGNAAGSYENAILYAPNSAVAYVKYSELYEGVNPKFSVDKMEEYLKVNPNSALARRELANRLYDLGRWTPAVEAFEPVIKNPSHLVEDEERYATLLMSGEKYEEAFQVAKGVIGRTENPNQMYRIMMHCKNTLEDYPEAAKWAAELMKSKGVAKIIDVDHVTYGDILASLAKVDTANMAQHYEAAINQFNEALAVNNKCEDAYKRSI